MNSCGRLGPSTMPSLDLNAALLVTMLHSFGAEGHAPGKSWHQQLAGSSLDPSHIRCMIMSSYRYNVRVINELIGRFVR